MDRNTHLRPINLDKFDISEYAYRELYYFCRQHREKQRKIKEDIGASISRITDMPHSSGVSDPTAKQAECIARLSKDVDMLERIAHEVAGTACYKALMANVVDGFAYENVDIPAGRSMFYYNIRKRFFYELAKAKGII